MKKTKLITVKVTDEQRKRWSDAAKASGRDVAKIVCAALERNAVRMERINHTQGGVE